MLLLVYLNPAKGKYMGKSLFIAEKPSVAAEFSKALGERMSRSDGFLESENYVVTWCVGHLVTMSYPEVYDEKYRRWSMDTLPFIPESFRYEVIGSVKKQFGIVKKQLLRKDVDTIYVCTDSGREGEYIYRLVAQMAGVKDKKQRRVWIDSQTREEILRGIREAKDLTAYDHLADSAYLRAKEDYLMGINFSRLLTLRYAGGVASFLGEKRCVISVGRVMTCVLGMVVTREREIRQFVKQPFYRVLALLDVKGAEVEAEFRAVEGSDYAHSPLLYKENGFKKEEDAKALVESLRRVDPFVAVTESIEKKKEKKNPPLLYNLAELQNDCSRFYHISPDQTLSIAQELYEKKLVTYPRTDARVLSSAVAKQIDVNIRGLTRFEPAEKFAGEILTGEAWKKISRTRYVDDKQITDHYALIPTGQGLGAVKSLSPVAYGVYSLICRRFLGIFYPAAEYRRYSLIALIGKERFFAGVKVLEKEGYLAVMKNEKTQDKEREDGGQDRIAAALASLRKGMQLPIHDFLIREGETTPPKRYNSGSMILAMENAGQLIEDETLREQIKGSGIGTSATRAEILKKLVSIKYLALNKKTQILTPTLLGEMVYDVVDVAIRQMLSPKLTASWEKGLTYVAEGSITPDEYMDKLKSFIIRRTREVQNQQSDPQLQQRYRKAAENYKGRTQIHGKNKVSI